MEHPRYRPRRTRRVWSGEGRSLPFRDDATRTHLPSGRPGQTLWKVRLILALSRGRASGVLSDVAHGAGLPDSANSALAASQLPPAVGPSDVARAVAPPHVRLLLASSLPPRLISLILSRAGYYSDDGRIGNGVRRSDGQNRPGGCAETSQCLVCQSQLFLRLFAFEREQLSRRSKERQADFREVGERCHCPGDSHISVETRVLFSSPAQHGHVRHIEDLHALSQKPHATQERLKQNDGKRRPNNP